MQSVEACASRRPVVGITAACFPLNQSQSQEPSWSSRFEGGNRPQRLGGAGTRDRMEFSGCVAPQLVPHHPKVRQREQRDDLRRVLHHPAIAHLGEPELALAGCVSRRTCLVTAFDGIFTRTTFLTLKRSADQAPGHQSRKPLTLSGVEGFCTSGDDRHRPRRGDRQSRGSCLEQATTLQNIRSPKP